MVFEVDLGAVANMRRNWGMFDDDRRALTPICTGEIYQTVTVDVHEAYVVINALQRLSEPTIFTVASTRNGITAEQVAQTLTDDMYAKNAVLQAFYSQLASPGTQHVA